MPRTGAFAEALSVARTFAGATAFAPVSNLPASSVARTSVVSMAAKAKAAPKAAKKAAPKKAAKPAPKPAAKKKAAPKKKVVVKKAAPKEPQWCAAYKPSLGRPFE